MVGPLILAVVRSKVALVLARPKLLLWQNALLPEDELFVRAWVVGGLALVEDQDVRALASVLSLVVLTELDNDVFRVQVARVTI